MLQKLKLLQKLRMFRKLTALCAVAAALLSITGCAMGPRNEPGFYVSALGDRERTNFTPSGYGWVPSSTIEISIFAEPVRTDTGEISAAPGRIIGTVQADSVGMFGFNSGAFTHLVPRRICGFPPGWLQAPFFMARDNSNGIVRFSTTGNDYWFTFMQCN